MTIDFQQPNSVVDWTVLSKRAARIMGYGADENEWTPFERSEIEEVVNEGLRMYYSPPVLDGFGQHNWNFMQPVIELETAQGQRWYELPGEFATIDNAQLVTYTEDNDYYTPIRIVPESHMRQMEYQTDYQSFPQVAAIRPKISDGGSGTAFEIGFHPTPDGTYRLALRITVAPRKINSEHPYPLGGPAHGQGFVAAVEAAAEMYEHERRGDYYNKFVDQLRSDIEMDARRHSGHLGYNGDLPQVPSKHRRSEYLYFRTVTYNGQIYNG